jgi:hypothetical protein
MPGTSKERFAVFISDFAKKFGLRAREVAREHVRLASKRGARSLAHWTAVTNELERADLAYAKIIEDYGTDDALREPVVGTA